VRTVARPRDSSRGDMGLDPIPVRQTDYYKKNKEEKKKIISFLVSSFLFLDSIGCKPRLGRLQAPASRQATDRSVEKARHVHGQGRLPNRLWPQRAAASPRGSSPRRHRTETTSDRDDIGPRRHRTGLPSVTSAYGRSSTGQQPWRGPTRPAPSTGRQATVSELSVRQQAHGTAAVSRSDRAGSKPRQAGYRV